MADFTFTLSPAGHFATIYAENAQAAAAWSQIDAVFGAGIIPMSAWPSVKMQLQDAGYTVRKAARVRVSADALLAELLA